jgi:ABC-type transporter Mla MlaB component
VKIARDESGQVLILAGTLEIRMAGELQNALRDLVDEVPNPAVDLSGADECDVASFQLLCSACKTAERSGKHFQVIGASDAILDAGAALGLPLQEALAKRGNEHAA